MTSLQQYAERINAWAEEKGWNKGTDQDPDYDALAADVMEADRSDRCAASVIKEFVESRRTQGDWVALAHSELSEGLEAIRNGEDLVWFDDDRDGKPEGVAVEYIDCIVRILHWFAVHKIDPDKVMETKLAYNDQRSKRHGGKKL